MLAKDTMVNRGSDLPGVWRLLVHPFNRRITADRRYDLILVSFAFVSSVALLIYRLAVFNDENAFAVGLLRTCMAISLLRLLVLLPIVNSLLYSLLVTLTAIKIYAIVLVITMYFFAAIAYYLFRYDNSKFESVFASFVTMFQMLVGEGWHEVMYATSYATNRLNAWFFIIYVFIVGVLFSQLFVGIIINMYSEYEALRRHGELYIELAFTQRRALRTEAWLSKTLDELVKRKIVKDSDLLDSGSVFDRPTEDIRTAGSGKHRLGQSFLAAPSAAGSHGLDEATSEIDAQIKLEKEEAVRRVQALLKGRTDRMKISSRLSESEQSKPTLFGTPSGVESTEAAGAVGESSAFDMSNQM